MFKGQPQNRQRKIEMRRFAPYENRAGAVIHAMVKKKNVVSRRYTYVGRIERMGQTGDCESRTRQVRRFSTAVGAVLDSIFSYSQRSHGCTTIDLEARESLPPAHASCPSSHLLQGPCNLAPVPVMERNSISDLTHVFPPSSRYLSVTLLECKRRSMTHRRVVCVSILQHLTLLQFRIFLF